MGDNTTYKVNDDGSVTVAAQLTEQEQNIIEILRIEKSKGGVFASRRMKNRAINYAKTFNYPDFKVDKLMLDNYPDDFANYPRTTSLIVWLIIGIAFFCGAIFFAYPSYWMYMYDGNFDQELMWCLLGFAGCIAISLFSFRQYKRIEKQINTILKTNH